MEEKQIFGYVYLVKNLVNGKMYFGITENDFDTRYKHGDISNTHNDHLKSSIKKYGIENFEINKEFDVAYTEDDLYDLEDMYMCIYNTLDPKYGYNKKRSGSKHKGNGKLNEQTKQKISESRKGQHSGEKHPLYGIGHSDESKKKMSDSQKRLYEQGYVNPTKGKHLSEEHKQRLSETRKQKFASGEITSWNLGQKMSDESKQKMSKAHKGKTITEEQRQKTSETMKKVWNDEDYRKRMSDIHKTREHEPHSEETKKKISKSRKGQPSAFKGKHHSEESKQKISDSLKGKKLSEETKQKLSENSFNATKVICLETLQIFDTINKAQEWCNIKTGVGGCCRGKAKSAGKHPITKEPLHWMLYEDYLKLQEEEQNNDNLDSTTNVA